MADTRGDGPPPPPDTPAETASFPDELVWKASHEGILKRIGEQCIIYEILHRKSSAYYLRQSRRFNVPIIVLSTISGSLSFSSESIPADYRAYVPFGVGVVNIFVGILSTISSLLLLNENYKLHAAAEATFGKLARSIACKLELPRQDRGLHGTVCVQEMRAEFESALEKAPKVSKTHVTQVRNKQYSLHAPPIIEPMGIDVHDVDVELGEASRTGASSEGGGDLGTAPVAFERLIL